MKRLLLHTTILMVVSASPVAAQSIAVGDTIAIISPSSATDTATINGGVRTLQSWGFPCVVAPHALDDYRGFAGTADQRLSDLLWALRAPHIRAVMCSRGGDGAVQLLCQLPPDTLRRYAKPIIGFSDVTALLSAQASVGVQGIHGSMCHAIATYHGTDTVSQALRHMLMGQMPVYKLPSHVLNQQGWAEGILVGGNMSVLHGLAGSDYDPLLLPDIILFLEDTGEGISKVDRMLHNIELRGLMSHVRGVIIGQFTKYKHPDGGFTDMNDMFHEYLQHYDIPVCYDFPVGHSHLRNFPLPVGHRATLVVSSEGTTLSF
jgi:muramoyltetrapeptide carboxypeptidase